MSIHADPPPPIVTEPHGVSYATANQLGKGGFAICHKAERLDGDKPTGHLVALKIVRTKMDPPKLAQKVRGCYTVRRDTRQLTRAPKFITELQIHSKLSHPNIVGFHRAFSFTESTYVVLELCSSGSLADLLKRRKCLTMPEIRRLMIQVCGAVKYLHTRNIVHRDLKTGNLFLDDNMNVKVGDFGLAALLVSGKDMEVKRRTTMCGTPNYLAPEILEKGKGHSEKVDLWAIGVISYTLAVGKAPFHAASKEEIYKKLKAGEYSWPELSAITNDISADLRDLVSTLLVPEELRPCPDKIVAHPFFKIAFVPTKMSRTQTTKVPTWPIQLPSPEVLQRGYSDTWWHVCKETGVGEYAAGRCFQLNAGQRIRSIVKDMEKEIAAGRQPTIPIPPDTVYTRFPCSSSWALNDIVEEREVAVESRQLKEISHNEVQAVPSSRRIASSDTDAKKKRDADLMPPPRRRGDLTVRKTRAEPEVEKVEVESVSTRPLSHEVPRPASRSSRTPPTTMDSESQGSKPLERSVSAKRPADATLARRPRTMRKQTVEKEEAVPAVAQPKPEPISGTVRRYASTRASRSRTKQPVPEAIEIYSDGEKEKNDDQPLNLGSIPRMAAQLPMPTRKAPEPSTVLQGSDPEAVLQRLSQFRDNLASALERRQKPSRRRTPTEPTKPLPFVSRWVDYSRKHGVGYVLDDGTVGFIASGNVEKSSPVMHVAVRNGERWLKRIGKKFENLDKVPFHILEDQEAGIGRMSSFATNDDLRERQRMLRVLWVKFGRYMSQSLGSAEEEGIAEKAPTQGDLQFVRFYQRMGNVGVWAFSDGCLQVWLHSRLITDAITD